MLQAPEQGSIAQLPYGEHSGDLLDRSAPAEARDDAALIAAARDGDDEAFRVLFRRYQHDARREAFRRGAPPSAAEDAVSAAFASVFRAVAGGGGPETFLRPYLLKAVRNAIIDQSRRAKVRPTLEPLNDMEVADPKSTAVDVMGRRMTSALATLPQRQRLALWATEVEGRSATEMADELQLSSNGFAALKKRARQNLSIAYAAQVTGGDTCAWVTAHARRYVEGLLNTNDSLLVELHVEGCTVCASLLPERERVRRPVLLLPLLLAGPAMRTTAPSSAWFEVSRRLHRLVSLVRGAGAAGVMAVPAGIMVLQLAAGIDGSPTLHFALGQHDLAAAKGDLVDLPAIPLVESKAAEVVVATSAPIVVAADGAATQESAAPDTVVEEQPPYLAPTPVASTLPAPIAPPPVEVAPVVTVPPTTTLGTVPAPATTVPNQPIPTHAGPSNVAPPTTTTVFTLTVTTNAPPTTDPPRSSRS